MSDIKDVEKLASRQIDTLTRKNAREVKNIESAHELYKSEQKKSHDGEIVEIQDQHTRQLVKENEKRDKVLTSMKESIQTAESITNKQLAELKSKTEKEKVAVQTGLSLDRERTMAQHELNLEEMNNRFSEKSKDIHHDGQGRIEDMKHNVTRNYTANEEFLDKKVRAQSEKYSTELKTDTENFERMKNNHEITSKKEFLNRNQVQQKNLSKLVGEQNKSLELREKEYRRGLKDQDVVFEKKYSENLKGQNEIFKEMENRHVKAVDKLKTTLSTEIIKTRDRSDDPFYKFEELKPKLTQHPDRVEVEVEVPEHAKQDLHLTLNNKEVVISFNRSYADNNRSMDGAFNKVSKVESFTTRMKTDHVLDAKSIKSSYNNGVMSYVIMKT